MKTRLAGVTDEPPHDPARAELAAAIERRNGLRRDLEALRAADGESMMAVMQARQAQEAATAALQEAKEAAAGAIVDKALGRTGDAVPSIATARRLLIDAEDALEIAQEARQQRATAENDTVTRLSRVNDQVTQAAARVLAESPGVRHLVSEVARLQREMLETSLALEWLQSQRAVYVPDGSPADRDATMQVSRRMHTPPSSWNGLLHHTNIQGAAPWKRALEALRDDANAPLPG